MKSVLGLKTERARELLQAEGKLFRMVEVRSKKGGKGDDARVIRTVETGRETIVYWSAFQTQTKA